MLSKVKVTNFWNGKSFSNKQFCRNPNGTVTITTHYESKTTKETLSSYLVDDFLENEAIDLFFEKVCLNLESEL